MAKPKNTLETIACEVPVVATKVERSLPLFKLVKQSCLFRKKEPGQITQTVQKLLAASECVKNLESNARALVQKQFNGPPMMDTFKKFYEEKFDS